MNILFLTLSKFVSYRQSGIYTDLLRKFIKTGNKVYSVTSAERRTGEKTRLIVEDDSANILVVKTLNIQKTNVIEKGLGTLLINHQYKRAIKKYFKDIKFDLILYPTPPITLYGVVKYIKKRDNAKTYLMLKDIFPQNAIDLGMLSKRGLKGLLYKYFRKKEKKFYAISDKIGCMSQANVDYVLAHNPEIERNKVEICPNSIEVRDLSLTGEEKITMREKYALPLDKKIFVYGGNLGKPQGVPFIIDCLRATKDKSDVFFLIVGDGTEYGKFESFVNDEKPANVRYMKRLPKEDYDRMIAACDVGLIFLDYRFTIPNFPSRLLSYMQAGLPVLACTDLTTDVGKVIMEGGFGWWCESNDVVSFCETVDKINCIDNIKQFVTKEKGFLEENYSAKKGYEIILDFYNEN